MKSPVSSMSILSDLQVEFFRESDNRLRLVFYRAYNEKGIIYRLTAVLFMHDWNIVSARAITRSNGEVEDVFIIENLKEVTPESEKILRRDLESLFKGEISVMHYISSYPHKLEELNNYHHKTEKPKIELTDSPEGDYTILNISTKDRPGLLFEISQLLYLLYIDIISFEAMGENGLVKDVFFIRCEDGTAIDALGKQRIKTALLKVL